MNEIKQIEPEYVYVTIPAEYICVYHRILAMMADYGEDMLKDCKANCTDRNSGVIECFNMFNSAVAARKLGKDKLAALIIKYIKVKINQIYKDKDNSTSFVFPVDETGQLKAFVSCGERPKFEINPDDMNLYEHKFNNGFDEHFKLGPEDESKDIENIDISSDNSDSTETPIPSTKGLSIVLLPRYENVQNEVRPCADINVYFDGEEINVNDTTYQYYFDDKPVNRFNDVSNLSTGVHNFKIVVTYNGQTKIDSVDKAYNTIDIKPDKPIVNKKSEMYKTVIANKAVPYFTAREGQVYYTNRFNVDVFNKTLTENELNTIERDIRAIFNNSHVDSDVNIRINHNITNFGTLIEAYNYYKNNINTAGSYIQIGLNLSNNKEDTRIYCGKTHGQFKYFKTPPYGNFYNGFNFPDKITISDMIKEKFASAFVLYLYRKKKDRIFIREKVEDSTDRRIIENKIADPILYNDKRWKPYRWNRLAEKNNYVNCLPHVIRISVRHRSKYGFAYYHYDSSREMYTIIGTNK